ncbi:hypothetical protein [Propionibacterium freudenreichii]|uniref:hypothetical protein n=1 Tax=Propionibacterium freudenreichii TaxID=1744 RepID=UPI00254CAEF3|nr:hypothetical protein [Propionibacterium freudenreichii]
MNAERQVVWADSWEVAPEPTISPDSPPLLDAELAGPSLLHALRPSMPAARAATRILLLSDTWFIGTRVSFIDLESAITAEGSNPARHESTVEGQGGRNGPAR